MFESFYFFYFVAHALHGENGATDVRFQVFLGDFAVGGLVKKSVEELELLFSGSLGND